MRLFTLLSLVCLLFGCSAPKPQSDARREAALPLMLIDPHALERDYQKPCTHTQACEAPLVCIKGQCDIPPSLLGDNAHDAPKLRFRTGLSEHEIALEICDDDYTRARGMMMRKAFHPDWGMLFIFGRDEMRSFWMRNTYIPLDMVFIRRDGSVANALPNAKPLDENPSYRSTDRVRYVLELPSGSIQRFGIDAATTFDMKNFGGK